ncbi:MAG: DUF1211 domain-containing protein [Actinomycetia bacterium]|nr:DUF1211 domain-containing protein [Actinomycetes bacterium]MCH9799958.1 DUF1211 domain-containing protein [Actinomycetes bacterium]
MHRADPVHTERGFDRLVNFTDAVAAIAATLLILPLISRVSDYNGDPDAENILLQPETWWQVLWFALTFWLITQFWSTHHQIFERVKDYTPRLMVLVFIWLAGIVFLAFPSGLLNEASASNFIGLMYFGGLTVVTVAAALMSNYVADQPQLLINPDQAKVNQWLWLFPGLFASMGLLSQIELTADYVYVGFLLIPVISGITAKHNPPAPPHTERGFDRIVNFSDAVIAIAITLLILPLIDVVSDATDSGDISDLDIDALWKGGAFLVTFFVMARFWFVHHRIFETLKDYSPRLITLSLIWLILMVFLAFSAGLQGESEPAEGSALLYLGTMSLINLVAFAIDAYAHRHPELRTDSDDQRAPSKFPLIFAALFLIMGVASLFIGPWCFLGFLLMPVIGRMWARRQ